MERKLGIADVTSEPREALELWYERVRDTPVTSFTLDDLGVACRQDMYPELVVPVAVEYVRENPLAGELYDGQLLVSLAGVSREYWKDSPEQARRIRDTISRLDGVDEDMRGDISRLLRNLSS